MNSDDSDYDQAEHAVHHAQPVRPGQMEIFKSAAKPVEQVKEAPYVETFQMPVFHAQ